MVTLYLPYISSTSGTGTGSWEYYPEISEQRLSAVRKNLQSTLKCRTSVYSPESEFVFNKRVNRYELISGVSVTCLKVNASKARQSLLSCQLEYTSIVLKAHRALILNEDKQMRKSVESTFIDIMNKTDVQIHCIDYSSDITQNRDQFDNGCLSIEISGTWQAVECARISVLVFLDELTGLSVDIVTIEAYLHPIIAGRKRVALNSIMHDTLTNIYLPTTLIGVKDVPFRFVNTIYITGKPENVRTAKICLIEAADRHREALKYLRIPCIPRKLDWLCMNHRHYLFKLIYDNATHITIPPRGSGDPILTLVGSQQVGLNRTLRMITRIICTFYVIKIFTDQVYTASCFEDEKQNEENFAKDFLKDDKKDDRNKNMQKRRLLHSASCDEISPKDQMMLGTSYGAPQICNSSDIKRVDLFTKSNKDKSSGNVVMYNTLEMEQCIKNRTAKSAHILVKTHDSLDETLSDHKKCLKHIEPYHQMMPSLLKIAQITGTEIVHDRDTITIYGHEEIVKEAHKYLAKMSWIQTYHKLIVYQLELAAENKEFVNGKKHGKVNKIVRASGCQIVFQEPYNDYNILIEIQATKFSKALNGLSYLEDEIPAEISFYVPESYHKRIIGVGGKNVQKIMKKFAVYIKFTNAEEFETLGGYFENIDNVIARTPAKNVQNLENLKTSIFEYLSTSHTQRLTVELLIPQSVHRLAIGQQSCNLRDITCCHGVQVIFPYKEIGSDCVYITGLDSQVSMAVDMLSEFTPRIHCLTIPSNLDLSRIDIKEFGELTACLSSSTGVEILVSSPQGMSLASCQAAGFEGVIVLLYMPSKKDELEKIKAKILNFFETSKINLQENEQKDLLLPQIMHNMELSKPHNIYNCFNYKLLPPPACEEDLRADKDFHSDGELRRQRLWSAFGGYYDTQAQVFPSMFGCFPSDVKSARPPLYSMAQGELMCHSRPYVYPQVDCSSPNPFFARRRGWHYAQDYANRQNSFGIPELIAETENLSLFNSEKLNEENSSEGEISHDYAGNPIISTAQNFFSPKSEERPKHPQILNDDCHRDQINRNGEHVRHQPVHYVGP